MKSPTTKQCTDAYQTSMLRMRLGWEPTFTNPETTESCFTLAELVDNLLPRRIRQDGKLYWLTMSGMVMDEYGRRWTASYGDAEHVSTIYEHEGSALIDVLVDLALELGEYGMTVED